MPRGRYAVHRLRRPAELAESLDRAGLRAREVSAFKPRDARGLVRATHRRRRGRLTDGQLPKLARRTLCPTLAP
ncbi:hypothetical protein [Streptomyces sp. NPDC050546]|uniref:hypothetical protein n=1 Tax=Streptomyces sp. NPDC050546 TaxID=3365628 RepID=UPI0037B5CD89